MRDPESLAKKKNLSTDFYVDSVLLHNDITVETTCTDGVPFGKLHSGGSSSVEIAIVFPSVEIAFPLWGPPPSIVGSLESS